MTGPTVLTVIETLGAGGAERALVTVLPELQRRGIRCEVAVLTEPLTLATDLEAAGIPVHHLRLRHRWDLRGVTRLAALARRRHVDVLHGHLFFGGLYVAATRPLCPRVRRVVTFHNLGYDSFPADTTWRRVRKRLDALLMRHAVDRHLAVSQAVADHYRRHLGIAAVDVVPNGFDVDALARVAPADLTTLGVDPRARVVVALGRLVPEKAHADLLAAFADVVGRLPGARLLVVGDGPLRADVEAAVARLGLTDHVVLAGYRPHDEALAITAAAHVFVSASTHEGFPLAPAEAMAMGTPVAVTAVGGVPDLVGDAGVLVPPRRPDLLAAAIVDVLGDDARRADLAARGRARVAEHFAAGVVADRLASIYAEVTG